jgi:hypothetical protein
VTTARTSHAHSRPGCTAPRRRVARFKKYKTARTIRLDLGHTTTLDLPLEVGGLAETVDHQRATPLVDVTSKQIGGNVTNREVTSLPSVNGNFVGMVALLPGIVANVSTESFGSDAVSANGMDSRNNNFLLDGANNNDDVIGQRAAARRARRSRRLPSSRSSPISTTPSSAAPPAPSSTPSRNPAAISCTEWAPASGRTRR